MSEAVAVVASEVPCRVKSGEDDDLAQDPEDEGHLEGEERVEQPPVEGEPEHRDSSAVVLQVHHCATAAARRSCTQSNRQESSHTPRLQVIYIPVVVAV